MRLSTTPPVYVDRQDLGQWCDDARLAVARQDRAAQVLSPLRVEFPQPEVLGMFVIGVRVRPMPTVPVMPFSAC